jgi:hypothetical protein
MHVPMCKVCGDWEVGTFTGSDEFCSEACEVDAVSFQHEISAEREKERQAQLESCYSYDAAGDGWGYDDCEAMYDNDPNPYAGTYSEE